MRLKLIVVAFALLATQAASAATVTVMTSGAFTAALKKLAPTYDQQTGNTMVIVQGPSMGVDPTAIPARLARGETADLVILARAGLDGLVAKKMVKPDTVTDIVFSRIAMAVKAGAPVPDISTLVAFKKTLLAAKSVAYSDSASGVYIETEMYKKMGIEKEMAPKSHKIQATPVGLNVARGEMELGFQQLSELKPIPGIHIVGVIPDGAQRITAFSAGVPVKAPNPDVAKALIGWLTAPANFAAIRETGLQPAKAK
jgi:molybdate transport system substrate-binding protein